MRRVALPFAGTKCKSDVSGSTFPYHTSTLPCGCEFSRRREGYVAIWSDNAQYNQWPDGGVITHRPVADVSITKSAELFHRHFDRGKLRC